MGLSRLFLIALAATAVGVAAKFAYELYRYGKWSGLEQELEDWKEVDKLGRNPSFGG